MTSLYIDRRGVDLRLDSDAIAFYENNTRIGTVPIAPLSRVFLHGNSTIETRLLAKLGERQVGVILLSGRKSEPTLFLSSPHNDVRRRIIQYELSKNPTFCLRFSKKIIEAKLNGQMNVLYDLSQKFLINNFYLTKGHDVIEALKRKVSYAQSIESVRGLEGAAANQYFQTLSGHLPKKFHFEGRNRRPPRDPFNALLSLGYTLLLHENSISAHGAGLDPFVGFFHSLNFARPSLSCDLMEAARPLIDRFALRLLTDEILTKDRFSQSEQGCFLDKSGRIIFYSEYEKEIEKIRKSVSDNMHDLIHELMLSCPEDLANIPENEEYH